MQYSLGPARLGFAKDRGLNWLGVALCAALQQGTWAAGLEIRHDQPGHAIEVFRAGVDKPILTHHARPDFRPFLHPIVAPDGRGVLTENRPDHHPHQTGVYFGLTRLNGRDFFHHPGAGYWRRVSASVLTPPETGPADAVQWQTVYDLLDEQGRAMLTETQIWTMREQQGRYVLDLQWTGEAKTEVSVGQYDYGGLFVRMPWRAGRRAEAINAARERNLAAEGRRAPWLDVGVQVDGRDDLAHIAVFDHPKNVRYPQPWRVDSQFGVGPALTREDDWQIARGAKAVLRYQLYVYTGPLDDVKLTRAWSEFSGHGSTSILWRLAQKEARHAQFLSADEAAQAMQAAEGFTVNVWAAEPMLTQPMAFCWDDSGRLWVAENRDYETRGRGFSNSGDSRILILEDTDRDGVADKQSVFWEGVAFPAALAVGFDGLWLGAPPNLLFIPDRNADDRADVEDIEVRLTGWGIRDRHETINNLHWGPDGWLYGCQGFATGSRVGKPAHPEYVDRSGAPFPDKFEYSEQPVDINGGVWRYHPTKERFEVVAHGFSNPWGIDYDAKGQLFITACVIPHLWHVIPGGIYHRQGGVHFNPYVYSDIRTIADHRHRSAHGGARIYLSDAFPKKYRGQIFMANIHEHALLADVLEPRGSGFVGRHGEEFLRANNAHWIGFGVEIGPGGDLYALDWHDKDICGNEVAFKETGRIYRVAPRVSQAQTWPDRYADLKQLDDDDLVALQMSASAWHARRARLILQARAAQGRLDPLGADSLRTILGTHANGDFRLRALWALHLIDGLDEEELVALLADQDAHLRAWSIQLLCEDGSPRQYVLDRFAAMASGEKSPVVRLYLAAALQRIAPAARWTIARRLVGHGEDAADHNLPKMIWFGIEGAVPEDPHQALDLAAESRMPLISRHVARRLVDADHWEPLLQALQRSSRRRTEMLLGVRDALAGRFEVAAPTGWRGLRERLRAAGGRDEEIASQLERHFDDAEANTALLATVADEQADAEERLQALRQLAHRKHPRLVSHLETLLDTDRFRRAAIQAAAAYEHEGLANHLLQRYPIFTPEEKLDAIHTLAARQSFGRILTEAIAEGKVPKSDVPAYVARLLRRIVGNQFADVWGPIDEIGADYEADFVKYRQLLTGNALAAADLREGRTTYVRTCGACHRLHNAGGDIGPELTGANRANLEYLLANILTPSAVIQDAYRMHLVLTDDGRVYSGVLAGENDRELRLRVASQAEPVVIPKAAVESREIAPISMMPAGQLKTLSDSEVVNLFAYLMSGSQKQPPSP